MPIFSPQQQRPQHKLIGPPVQRIPSAEIDLTATKRSKQTPVVVVRKSVSWDETVIVRRHIHVNDLTKDERSKTWYTRSQFVDIKRDIAITIKAFKKGVELPPNMSTFRGLESRTRAGAMARKANKLEAWVVVLDEQNRQRRVRINNDVTIGLIYAAKCAQCLKEAQRVANEDAAEALEFHSEVIGQKKIRGLLTSLFRGKREGDV